LAWFKKWSFWVTQTSEIWPLHNNDLQNKRIKFKLTCQAL